MAKLQPKSTNKEGTGIIGIKSLVDRIRDDSPIVKEQSISSNEKESTTNLELIDQNDEIIFPIDQSREITTSDSKLLNIINLIEEKNYLCKEVLYVDADIKEVFQLLKSKGKVPISSLVSYILEVWIKDNMEDIHTILNSKNKYI